VGPAMIECECYITSQHIAAGALCKHVEANIIPDLVNSSELNRR
jgi:hypothetical protein